MWPAGPLTHAALAFAAEAVSANLEVELLEAENRRLTKELALCKLEDDDGPSSGGLSPTTSGAVHDTGYAINIANQSKIDRNIILGSFCSLFSSLD